MLYSTYIKLYYNYTRKPFDENNEKLLSAKNFFTAKYAPRKKTKHTIHNRSPTSLDKSHTYVVISKVN